MLFLIGLGNPADQYAKNRHNIGFQFIDFLKKKMSINEEPDIKKKFSYFKSRSMYLVKTRTYMNLSGEAVVAVKQYFSCTDQELIIVYDDVNLPNGHIRLRKHGSAGGHNGLKNIIEKLGTQNFPRLRFGIANGQNYHDLADYVLSDFSINEEIENQIAFEKAYDTIVVMNKRGIDYAMNLTNQKFKPTLSEN